MANILDPTENLSPVSGLKGIYTKLREVIRRLNVLLANSGSSKVYKALITQSGTDAPVATVLVNTLSGTPVWSYSSTGRYVLTLTAEFTTDKTSVFINATNSANGGYLFGIFRANTDEVNVSSSSAGVLSDDVLNDTSITIEVFP